MTLPRFIGGRCELHLQPRPCAVCTTEAAKRGQTVQFTPVDEAAVRRIVTEMLSGHAADRSSEADPVPDGSAHDRTGQQGIPQEHPVANGKVARSGCPAGLPDAPAAPLSDDRIIEIARPFGEAPRWPSSFLDFAREIEAAVLSAQQRPSPHPADAVQQTRLCIQPCDGCPTPFSCADTSGCTRSSLFIMAPRRAGKATAANAVDAAIVGTVLKEAYAVIDQLMGTATVDKDLRNKVGRLLPAGYAHSFTKRTAGDSE